MSLRNGLATLTILFAALLAVPATAQVTAGGTSVSTGGGAAAGGGAAGGEAPAFQGSTVSNVYSADLNDPSRAFYGLDLPQHQLYTGIIPGVRDTLPHIYPHQVRGLKGRINQLTWIGFQKAANQPSRVFLQTFSVPAFRIEMSDKPNEIIVVLVDTKPACYNFLRELDTRYFPRSIQGIKARRFGRDTHIYIKTKIGVEYSVSINGNYLNVDFDDSALEREWIERTTQTVYDDPDESNDLRELDY